MSAGSKDTPKGYDRLKQHKGAGYSGMQVGRAHKWYYDQGEWRERKLAPDEWEIYYQTTKRRAAKAPDESGAPIGTQYNWLIVSHQRVDKLDANSYVTYLEGKKFKVAHKRAEKNTWSATEKAQRKKVIQYLEQVIEELKRDDQTEANPYTIGEQDRIYGLNLRTKSELYEMAKQYQVPSPSKLKREELLAAVKERLDRDRVTQKQPKKPSKMETEAPLDDKSKNDLYELASRRNVSGRSGMNKAELVGALRKS